ncbi:hypothetical protein BKA82DRAFT_169428 [Pisolithus tinctorius]|uniref:R3H domain-containing protein n=1 Tax=Pisolithus tinctorius Marx 270 TaxID=870435 RepID=A0A0C3NDZ0_PISTI|nr:hypothetical protein BKA82DRAFT_169428 [Pisolithus tinctorius]KIN94000.1 hypothetical protein M404DRAFT_169428 [Pisolithus tinctorius Marx 270]
METSTANQQSASSSTDRTNRNRRTHRRRAVANDRPADDPTTSQGTSSRSTASARPPRERPASERDTRQEVAQNAENRGPIRRKPYRKKADGNCTDPQSDQPSTAINASTAEADSEAHSEPSRSRSQPRSHRRAFNAKLTQPTETQAPPETSSGSQQRARKPQGSPAGSDLTSTLTRALRTPPYPDCLICFGPIRPEHPTWSCAPPKPSLQFGLELDDPDKERSQCCWTTFHLKCIRTWADKSVKSIVDAWRARGEERPGEWRCPGCQTKREQVPTTYQCFCHRTSNPSPPRLSTPHSCALPCSRPRSSGCKHPCPLPCHPGPCPPCGITVQRSCFCGKVVRNARCSASGSPVPSEGSQRGSFSCNNTCTQPLSCKNPKHRCELSCHADPCPPCPVKEEVRCWCGSETKVVACGELSSEVATECVILKPTQHDGIGEVETWVGWFGCGKACNRPFSCGKHTCAKPCHPPSRTPPLCPFDPVSVTRCGCGRYEVARLSGVGKGTSSSASGNTSPVFPARSSCTSPLPVCSSVCSKSLSCGHSCTTTCHWGVCPPCTAEVGQPCRCGSTKRQMKCSDILLTGDKSTEAARFSEPVPEEILCNRPCPVQRSCGRHQCGRICCPLASLAIGKGKKKVRGDAAVDLGTEPGGLHECDIPCTRVLGCGNHRCEKKDHKGPCGVCLRSIFEEITCPCNRMVFEPPIPCGTRLTCTYPCVRERPCGHPQVPHACHESTISSIARSCPPCPFLTRKLCACEKKMVDNVQCSQERVSCGNVCKRLLACGFHECKRTCHADECGPCTAVCGKSRKACLPEYHPCTEICHAPAACPETGPCLAVVTLTCPCGNLRSTAPCSNRKQSLACSGDCAVKKRNEKLAEAFGISKEKREEIAAGPKVVWSDELVDYACASANAKFVRLMEDTFADFVKSSRRTQVLQHMPPERRKFVQSLASVYRVDTAEVDQEPHRSVQLMRRIDTRIPVPLLSQSATSAAPSSKLVDLRSSKATASGVKTVNIPPSRVSSAWKMPSSSSRSAPSSGVPSSGPLPPHSSSPPPPSYVTLQPQVQREQPATIAREDVPEDWEDDT